MTRPTKKVTLPFTGKEVEIITYFTRGEKQKIRLAVFGEGKMSVENQEIDAKNMFANKDKALELGVKSLTLEEINDLPEEDGEFLEKEIDNLSVVKKK